MTTIRAIKRVSEEYIQDPATGLYYWLAPVYKRGTDQQLLDDMRAMVEKLAAFTKQGEQVLRPTAMIQRNAINKINPVVLDALSKNTYLFLFDWGSPKPKEIPDGTLSKEWVSEGNAIFLWSSDNNVYTWCNSNQLGHRYYRVPQDVALAAAFEEVQQPDEEKPIYIDETVVSARKLHITGNAGLLGKIDITVEAK